MVTAALATLLQRLPHGARLGRRLLIDRDVVIPSGVGKGLRFNAGASNPEYALGRNELPVQQALAEILETGGVFYDVGANVGFFTVIGARLSGPQGRVLAFEPVPENVAAIRHNLRLNRLDNVEVHEVAVASRSGTAELRVAEYSGGAALASAPPPPDLRGSIRVRTVALDDLVAGGAPAPDVIKVDVEGAELAVFEGMAEVLEHHRPALLFEVDAADAATLATRAAACSDWLRARGYWIQELPDCYDQGGWSVANFLARG